MRQLPTRIMPKAGFAHFIHIGLMCMLPLALLILVRLEFYPMQIGAGVILASKWRMFAVKPRHWPANIRANAVDIIVGLSILIFMVQSSSGLQQLIWAIIYGVWLLAIKPRSDTPGISVQAMVAQSAGLCAMFIMWGSAALFWLVLGGWLISYLASRHFFGSFEESMTRYLSATWGYFTSAGIWVLAHGLIYYGPIAQPALQLSVTGIGLGGIYYLEKSDRTSVLLRRQIVFVVLAVNTILLISLYFQLKHSIV